MRKYLLDHERIVVAVHQHWMRVAGVVAATITGFILTVLITLISPGSVGRIVVYAWWLWFALAFYCLAQLALWRHDWFVVTERRLLLTHGLVAQQIGMMPMAKVTDMSFNQSFVARFLHYGTFVMESAGQDQALRNIDYIPDAATYYRLICEQIFGEDDTDDEDDNDTRRHHRDRKSGSDDYNDPRDFNDYDYDHDFNGSSDHTDPFGVPVPTPPVQLPQKLTHAQRPAASYGPNRRRIVREAALPDAPDPSWSVSHEDASPPQEVRPPVADDPHSDDLHSDDPYRGEVDPYPDNPFRGRRRS